MVEGTLVEVLHFRMVDVYEIYEVEETSRWGSDGSWTSRRHMASEPSTGNPIKIEMSLRVMDARQKMKIIEFKPLD